jgi:hypothetical protein
VAELVFRGVARVKRRLKRSLAGIRLFARERAKGRLPDGRSPGGGPWTRIQLGSRRSRGSGLPELIASPRWGRGRALGRKEISGLHPATAPASG